MAKIPVECERSSGQFRGDTPRKPVARTLVSRNGWSVADVVCSAGPYDRPFEEQHSAARVAIVMGGSFQYQSSAGRALMTPGALLLGNAGQSYQCAHEYGVGDRCISFAYTAQFIEDLAADASVRSRATRFSSLRIPPVRELSNVVARACAGTARLLSLSEHCEPAELWEEIAVELAARALGFSSGGSNHGSLPAAEARVSRIVRMIESDPLAEHELGTLAREAKLSRYHFLRIFQHVTGLTPHQYVRRARLRHAATQLLLHSAPIIDIALDSGFGDVSNFNHAFRAEFGMAPRPYRAGSSRPRFRTPSQDFVGI